MGRPKLDKSDQRQQIGFRCNPDVRAKLEEAAKEAGISVGAEVERRIIFTLSHDFWVRSIAAKSNPVINPDFVNQGRRL